MADATTLPPRRCPLDSVWRPGIYGSPGSGGPGMTVSRRLGLDGLQLDARAGKAEAVRAALLDALGVALPGPGRAASAGDLRAIWTGPDRWLLLAAAEAGLGARLRAVAEPAGGIVVDQGHGRTILRVEGPAVREILAKGTGVDLHPSAFPEHAVALTALFHHSVTLDRRRGTGTFDIHVMRGFALSLQESLCEAAAEYGYRLA